MGEPACTTASYTHPGCQSENRTCAGSHNKLASGLDVRLGFFFDPLATVLTPNSGLLKSGLHVAGTADGGNVSWKRGFLVKLSFSWIRWMTRRSASHWSPAHPCQTCQKQGSTVLCPCDDMSTSGRIVPFIRRLLSFCLRRLALIAAFSCSDGSACHVKALPSRMDFLHLDMASCRRLSRFRFAAVFAR